MVAYARMIIRTANQDVAILINANKYKAAIKYQLSGGL